MTTPAEAARGRRAMTIWASVIIGLLSLQVVLCAIGVYAATAGKGVAVENDYYDKALHWDAQKAQSQASSALGWTVQLSVADIAAPGGNRNVTLTVLDKDRTPIRDAHAALKYFHHAHARDIAGATLAASDPGLYTAALPVSRPGTWEFRLEITRGKDIYTDRILREVSPAHYIEAPVSSGH